MSPAVSNYLAKPKLLSGITCYLNVGHQPASVTQKSNLLGTTPALCGNSHEQVCGTQQANLARRHKALTGYLQYAVTKHTFPGTYY